MSEIEQASDSAGEAGGPASTTGVVTASVVIATLNEESHICGLLTSLITQSIEPTSLEIIIVDGRSTDQTRARIEDFAVSHGWADKSDSDEFHGRSITILDNPTRTTPCAFNTGVSAAGGDVVIIVGAHSVVDERFVEASIAALEETGASVVGGSIDIVTTDPSMTPLARAQQSALGTGGARYRTPAETRQPADTVPFPAFQKQTWSQVGGFDEELLRNQDDEFILRVRQAGGTVVLCPHIHATYFARPSLSRLRKQYYEYGFYRILTIRKRGRPGSLRPLAPLAMVAMMTGCLIGLVLGRKLAAVPVLAYSSACALEGIRLNRDRPSWAPRSAAAIIVMQWAYGIGEWAGIIKMIRRRSLPT